MTMQFVERASDSPYIESITHGYTLSAGQSIRPAEIHWHMVFVKHSGGFDPLMVGPLTTAGAAAWGADAEILWIKFKLGAFMPHLPARCSMDKETRLPTAASRSFWLKGAALELPTYENVETFINRLVRDDVLVRDPLVSAVLQDQPQDVSPRTVRHRFLQATGLPQMHIRQYERAQQAGMLLRQGVPILDVVFQLGYYDQPHLTRSLKQFVGYTPAQLLNAVK